MTGASVLLRTMLQQRQKPSSQVFRRLNDSLLSPLFFIPPTHYGVARSKENPYCFLACNGISSTSRLFATSSNQQNWKTGIQRIVSAPVGSMDDKSWDKAEDFLRNCHCYSGGIELAFDLLDRIFQEEQQEPIENMDDEERASLWSSRNNSPLNHVIYKWRNEYVKQSTRLLPSQVLHKIRVWNNNDSKGNLVPTCVKPDTKTYAMILEAACNSSQQMNHHKSGTEDEGLVLADSLLQWMIEECRIHNNFSIQPTVVCFATVMNGWVASAAASSNETKIHNKQQQQLIAKKSLERVKYWMHRLTELHEEGWSNLRPNIFVYNILLNALARAGDVESAEQVLQSMLQKTIPVDPDRISFTTLLSAYTTYPRSNNMGRAENLLSQMHELYQAGMEWAKPNVISYTTVMDGYSRMGDGAATESLLLQLEELYKETGDPDFKLDAAAYNTAIMAWSRANEPDRADELLRYMYENGVAQPNERSFNSVLAAWAKRGAPEKAEMILKRMHELYTDGELETQPTVVAYNIVLDSWAKSKRKDAWRRAEAILKHMEKLAENGDTTVKPNSRSWNTVLNCFAKAGQIQRAEKLVEVFSNAFEEGKVDEGPNIKTWNTLLSCFMENREVRRARYFFGRMKKQDILPDIVSYNTLLNCFARASAYQNSTKGFEECLQELRQDEKVSPNRITYLAIINFWIGAGELDKAEAILKEICQKGATEDAVEPDRELFHKVLVAWSDQRKPKKAERLLLMMTELYEKHGFDLKPTVGTYNRILNGWAKSMEWEAGERADQILRQMEDFARAGDEDVIPDLISYNTVLNAWANSGNPAAVTRSEHLVLEMILKGNPRLTPTEVSYGTWLKAIAKSNENDKARRAQEVLKTMKIHELEPTGSIKRIVEELTRTNVTTANSG